jgi:hypothetical protein
MSSIRNFAYLVIGIFVPLTIGIIVLELTFGSWILRDEWAKTRAINIVRDVQVTYNVENIYGKDLPEAVYTRDKNGLRGSCSQPSSIDILTLGGSTTDQRYIPDGKTYQDILQKLLSDKFSKDICISNAGVDGHSTFGHIASFQTWFPLIENLKPKYFLFYVGVNDAGFRYSPNSGFDSFVRPDESRIREILREHSAIYDLIRTMRQVLKELLTGVGDRHAYAGHSLRPPDAADYSASKLSPDVRELIEQNTIHFKNRFQTLINEVQKYDAIPICISQPHIMAKDFDGTRKGISTAFTYQGKSFNGLDYDASITALSTAMRDLCVGSGGYFIDIASKQFQEGDFYDVVHMTSAGASRLGGYIYGELISMKVPF